MATYAIGDVQGMAGPLRRLLGRLALVPGRDRVWLVGDLVNRGPASAEALRIVRALEVELGPDRVVVVLGNHDLYLLARAIVGLEPRDFDTVSDVLEAEDRDDLIRWLLARPLAHHDPGSGVLLVHAGVHPGWSAAGALSEAQAVEATLRGPEAPALLRALFGLPAHGGAPEPPRSDRWHDGLSGLPRLSASAAVMTRLRALRPDGSLHPYTGSLPGLPGDGVPWWRWPDHAVGRASTDGPAVRTVVFGHWAALGLHRESVGPGPVEVLAIDTGCVWGGPLTAVRLDDGAVLQEPASPA